MVISQSGFSGTTSKRVLPLNEADPTTFFGLGSKGYTDYPTMEELESQEGLAIAE